MWICVARQLLRFAGCVKHFSQEERWIKKSAVPRVRSLSALKGTGGLSVWGLGCVLARHQASGPPLTAEQHADCRMTGRAGTLCCTAVSSTHWFLSATVLSKLHFLLFVCLRPLWNDNYCCWCFQWLGKKRIQARIISLIGVFNLKTSRKKTAERCFVLQNVRLLKMFVLHAAYVCVTGVSNPLTAVQQTLENSLGFAYIKPSSLAFTIVGSHWTRW